MGNPIFNQFQQQPQQNGNLMQQIAQVKQMLGNNNPTDFINLMVSRGMFTPQQVQMAREKAKTIKL